MIVLQTFSTALCILTLRRFCCSPLLPEFNQCLILASDKWRKIRRTVIRKGSAVSGYPASTVNKIERQNPWSSPAPGHLIRWYLQTGESDGSQSFSLDETFCLYP